MPTIKLTCVCDHSFQDSRYGYKVRVHNVMGKERKARCSVCGNVREVATVQRVVEDE
jgi:hypothetical protein